MSSFILINIMSILTNDLSFDLLGILLSLVVVTYTYSKWKLTYWDRIGLPTLSPSLIFGDMKDLFVAKAIFGECLENIYKIFKYRGLRHGGIYFGLQPFYVPIDRTIIKHIMVIDFEHFVNHATYVDEARDPLSGHLFNLEDAKWKKTRAKLTPTFTSGKIKTFFQTLTDCTNDLKTIMDEAADKKLCIEIREVLGRLTTDIIGSVGFGIKCNTLNDPNSLFRKYGRKIFEDTELERLNLLLPYFLPHNLLRLMRYKSIKSEIEVFFKKTVEDVVSYREDNNIYQKDFMGLLLQLRNNGLTMNELAALTLSFFGGGFESSSATMTWALLELAINPDIQDKLRDEINTVLAKYDGEMTYNGIVMEMPYMDKVLKETLRKYPPLAVLERRCTKDYTIPQTSITLEKGVGVFIPILGLHMDPEYYPNPKVFDPERFSEEMKKTRPAFTWLPFGDGPRNCIGYRYGLTQSKVGLTALLRNYKFSLNEKTKIPIIYDKYTVTTTALGGVWLNVTKLNENFGQ